MTAFRKEIISYRNMVIATLLFVAMLLPFLAWSFFIFPVADDLSPVKWDLTPGGLLETLRAFRKSQGGAYFAVALRWLHAPLTLHGLYALTPLLFMLVHLFGGGIAFRVGFRCIDTWLKAFSLSAVWLAAYLATMYSTAEGVFWATGMLVYEPGNVLALILTAFAGSVARTERRHWAWLLLLVPAAIGSHFPFALWGVCVLAYRVFRTSGRREDSLLLIYALVFFAVIFSAPGNFHRHSVATQAAPPAIAAIAFKSVLSFGAFIVREVSLVQNWMFFALVCLLRWRDEDEANPAKNHGLALAIAALAWLLPLFGIFVLSAASKFDPPFPRTLNTLHYLFVCGGAFLIAPNIVSFARRKFNSSRVVLSFPEARHMATMLLVFSVASPNWVQCVRDLLGSGREYKQHWVAINQAAATARNAGKTRVEIPADPQVRPPTVFHRSWLKTEPNEWPNETYATFFGVSEVVAIPEDKRDR